HIIIRSPKVRSPPGCVLLWTPPPGSLSRNPTTIHPNNNRQTFLGAVAGGLILAGKRVRADEPEAAAPPAAPPYPIIDTHIHLFDPFRPQGTPWPNPKIAVLYKTSLPSRYRPIAMPLGVVGAIEIECSSWLEDNQW